MDILKPPSNCKQKIYNRQTHKKEKEIQTQHLSYHIKREQQKKNTYKTNTKR